MVQDLMRTHDFASERIGFLCTKTISLRSGECIVLAIDYLPVDDKNYIYDPMVGAKINSAAFRIAMQDCLDKNYGCFHVHLHDHFGKPFPSPVDKKSNPGIITSLGNVARQNVYGVMILSRDSFYTEIKTNSFKKAVSANAVSIVGSPFIHQFDAVKHGSQKIFDRQSFLGEDSQFLFDNIRVGIVGYGGGGSHIGQQLAHLGVKNITIFDNDHLEASNLNRLIGGFYSDIKDATPKTSIASRLIKKILPKSKVDAIDTKWQLRSEDLKKCDIVVGCLDSYLEREQLESECRRNLIPLIDIGMDVHNNDGYSISGQVILSMPGNYCMKCYGFLTEQKLAIEAAKYGNVGGRPQVVWPNGVLASTAVGVFVNMLTGWAKNSDDVYLAYDGNVGTITDHIRKKFVNGKCTHFPLKNIGEVQYQKL